MFILKEGIQKRNNKYIKELRRRPTKAEEIVGRYLIEKEIYFIFQKGFLKPFHRIVDFYFPVRGIILEIDGGYHKTIIKKDNHKDYCWIKDRRMLTIRITNEDVFNGKFKIMLEPHIMERIEKDKNKSKCPKNWF